MPTHHGIPCNTGNYYNLDMSEVCADLLHGLNIQGFKVNIDSDAV